MLASPCSYHVPCPGRTWAPPAQVRYFSLDCLQLCLALLVRLGHLELLRSVLLAACRLHNVHGRLREALNPHVLGHVFLMRCHGRSAGQQCSRKYPSSEIWNIVLALQMLILHLRCRADTTVHCMPGLFRVPFCIGNLVHKSILGHIRRAEAVGTKSEPKGRSNASGT